MLKEFRHPLTEKELLELRGKIIAQGYRIKEFAEKIGYSPITLSLFLHGRSYSKKLHQKILQALEEKQQEMNHGSN